MPQGLPLRPEPANILSRRLVFCRGGAMLFDLEDDLFGLGARTRGAGCRSLPSLSRRPLSSWGGLVRPRLHRPANRRCSQSHDDGGRPAASAAHRAQAGDGRGAKTTVTGCGRGCRCPGGASGQRDAVSVADVCDFVGSAAVAAQHRWCLPTRPRTFCRRPHLSCTDHRSPAVRLSRTPSQAELEFGEPIAGPVPVPRAKPGPVAALHGAVPLPRPKPTQLAPGLHLPPVDRHSVN